MESQSILSSQYKHQLSPGDVFEMQDTQEYFVEIRDDDNTPDIYMSVKTQTEQNTKDICTQTDHSSDAQIVLNTAKLLAERFFPGKETQKEKFIRAYYKHITAIVDMLED